MNSLVIVFCLAISAASAVPWWNGPTSSALVGPSNPGVLLRGPSDSAKVAGPDGSLIIASAQADSLWAPPQAGGVVRAAAVPGAVGLSAPIVSTWGAPLAVKSAWAPNVWGSQVAVNSAWAPNVWGGPVAVRSAWGPSAGLVGVGLRGW